MKKKVKKFGAGGDIVTALGVGLIGKALYDKYKEGKGKDDEESDYAKKVREFRDSKKAAAEPAPEPAKKEEDKPMSREEYLSKKTTPIKETGTFKGSDTAEPDLEYKSKPAAKKTTTPAKKAEPAAQPKKVELPKPGESKVVGEGALKPYPKDVKKPEPPVTGKSTPKTLEDTSKKATKYGIGPYGAFGSIHKAMSEYKTPAEVRSEERRKRENKELAGMKKGGVVKSSASRRADGIAQRGKTKGRIC